MMRRDPNPGAIVAGVLFIALGVVFLVDRLHGIDLDVRGLGIAGLVRSRAPR